jgi:hypothetical protein
VPTQREQIQHLIESSHRNLSLFVSADLALGRTFCKVARLTHNKESRHRAIASARRAQEVVARYIESMGREDPEYEQMMAEAELLKSEIEALDR